MAKTEPRTKTDTYAAVTVDHFIPKPADEWPKVINACLSYDEALKLHMGLQARLQEMSRFHRGDAAGKREAVVISFRHPISRVVVMKGKTRKTVTK